jgi:cysteinyl-tRNA synthetase
VPARHWVHGEHLLMAGRKMAKSAGNFVRITELAESADPLAFRYLALTARYGRKLNLSPESFEAAAAALGSLRAALATLPPPADGPYATRPLRAGAAPDRPDGIADGIAGHGDSNDGYDLRDRAHHPAAPLSETGRGLHDAFVAALDDDLDTPAALAIVRRMLRADLPPDERRWLVLDADAVLGLDLERSWATAASTPDAEPDATVRRLAERRSAARRERDFAAADALRREIEAAGWEVEDRADGPRLRRR